MKPFARLLLPFLLAVSAVMASAETSPAPSWTLKDLDGKEVSSAQFAGKLLVVDFWATWCGPCIEEIPGYIELQKKYGKDGLVIVGVSLDRGGVAKVRKFVAEHRMNYTVVMGSGDIAEAFGGLEAIPTTFLISRDGQILHRKMGSWSHADYEALVKKHL